MEARLDKLYAEVNTHEQHLEELYQRLFALNKNLLTKDKILKVLQSFTQLYDVMSPIDRQTLIRTIVSEIELFPDKQPDGRVIKRIRLAIPVVYDNDENPKICWDKDPTVETVVLLTREQTQWEKYGEYFMNRSVSDIMEEYGEQRDEWKAL